MNYNINFCFDSKKDFNYCYNVCKRKRCSTLSNLCYGYIINPLTMVLRIVNNKFIKCNQLPTQCSFLFCKKYCGLHGKCK